MASSLIPALAVTAPTSAGPPASVTDGERGGQLDVLAAVPDPRDPRGIRYPLASLLAMAVCAVPAGASSFAAITDWLHDLDDTGRTRLGFASGIPAGTTVWRLLIRLVVVTRKGDPNPMIGSFRLAAEAVLTAPAA
ncbi:transposase family protein [Catenuloplanes sp. NPDC051500]|uniref:transposase family protein n=1 Tax=Catenuloplanes sp. NPDC051500 TaxID=3363959 RepID=UPI0037A753EA